MLMLHEDYCNHHTSVMITHFPKNGKEEEKEAYPETKKPNTNINESV